MFNLIVKSNGWAEGQDTVLGTRIFEYTEQSLVDSARLPDGRLDLTMLITYPTLFVQEKFGLGDQIARVGTIFRAYMSGRNVVLEYAYDQAIPPIQNRQLQSFAAELDIVDFQFPRTHWFVKNRDLYRALLRNLQPRRRRPTVFQIADPEAIEPTLISAMMPFRPSFALV